MPDFAFGGPPDPVQLLSLVLAILAAFLLAVGLLELLLFGLLTVLLTRQEARRKAPLLLGLLVLGLVPGTGPAKASGQEEADRPVPVVEAGFTRVFSSDTMNIGGAALSPDGRWLAFDSFQEGVGNIWVVPTAGGEPIRLTTGRHVHQSPQWFPSGDRIAFLSDQVAEDQGILLYVMSIPFDPETGEATGPARQVSLEPAREPSISPDGRWIAYGTYIFHGALKVIPSNGGAARTLFDREDSSPRDPTWSPDSRQVYFHVPSETSGTRRLMRVSVDGGEAEEVSVFQGGMGPRPPDGSYQVREVADEASGGKMLELTDPQDRVLGRVPLHRNMGMGYPVGFTPDGMGVTTVVRDLVAPIFVAPLAGGEVRRISEVRAYERVLGWTPDSRQVFYRTRLNGRDAVLRTPLEGGPTVEIPLPQEVDDAVTPSGDGRYLAYALGPSADTGQTVMVRRVSDGERWVMTDGYVLGLRPGREVLGPGGGLSDGNEFLYLERDGERWELRASPPEGPSRLVRAVTDTAWVGQGGPNSGFGIHGDWVAHAHNYGDSAQLILSTAPEEEHVLVTVPGGLDKVCWSYDRRWIATGHITMQGAGFEFDLLLVPITPEGALASEPLHLDTDAWVWTDARWLPDNQTIAVFGLSRGGVSNHLWLIPIRDEHSSVEVPLGDPSRIWSAALSPDGRQVAFSEEVPRGSSIWIVDYGTFLREMGVGGR